MNAHDQHLEATRSRTTTISAEPCRFSLVIFPGFLGVFCNQVLFLYGVKLTNATVASIVHLTLPLFAAALAIGFGLVGRGSGRGHHSPLLVHQCLYTSYRNPIHSTVTPTPILGDPNTNPRLTHTGVLLTSQLYMRKTARAY